MVWEDFYVEFNQESSIYSQIIELLSSLFVRGDIKEGQRIPSIRDMALTLKVNANTMQRVYKEMERRGIIISKRGTGYFFTEDKSMVEKIGNKMVHESISRFLGEMRALGFSDKQILNGISDYTEGGKQDENIDATKGDRKKIL